MLDVLVSRQVRVDPVREGDLEKVEQMNQHNDTRRNDIQHNDTQHNDILHNNTQHYNTKK